MFHPFSVHGPNQTKQTVGIQRQIGVIRLIKTTSHKQGCDNKLILHFCDE